MKIATIGSGRIVHQFMEAAMAVKDVELVAMYSRVGKVGAAEALATTFAIEHVYDDLSVMLADETIDIVYVASPNSVHFEQVSQVLTAGKSAISEKPFMSNLQEAKILLQLAKEQGVFLFEGIPLIHAPSFQSLAKDIESLLNVKNVQCNYSQYSSRYDDLLNGHITNIFSHAFSGGALMDINIYNIHFCVGLFGAPNHVQYLANKHETGIDTSGIVLLEYPTFTATCFGAKDAHGVNFAQIQAENGYVYIPDGVNGMDTYELILNEQKEVKKIGEKAARLQYEIQAFKSYFDLKDYTGCYALLEEHTLVVMAVIDAAKQSAEIVFGNDVKK